MKLEIQINDSNIYMRTDIPPSLGGFVMAMYRGEKGDSVGFDGDESQREFALKLADVCLERK